jgi:ribosomal protein L24
MNNYKLPFYVLLVLCFILAYLLRESKEALSNINPNTITVDSGRVVAQRQRILELEEAVRLGLIEKTHMINKIAQQSKIQAQTIIVEKKIPIQTEKVIIIDTATMDTSNYVRVPFKINQQDSWYSIIGHVDTSYFTLDTLKVNNALSIVVGEHKGKWWQKNEPMVEVKSSNPYTDIKIENVTIKQNRKFWQRPLFGVLIGAIGMLLIL